MSKTHSTVYCGLIWRCSEDPGDDPFYGQCCDACHGDDRDGYAFIEGDLIYQDSELMIVAYTCCGSAPYTKKADVIEKLKASARGEPV